jgi:hypothetical protein
VWQAIPINQMDKQMAPLTLNDEFPRLRALGVLDGNTALHDYFIAGVVNTTNSSAYTLHTAQVGLHTYDLRIVGLGDGCYFVWTDKSGNAASGQFHLLEVGEIRRLQSSMTHDHAKRA